MCSSFLLSLLEFGNAKDDCLLDHVVMHNGEHSFGKKEVDVILGLSTLSLRFEIQQAFLQELCNRQLDIPNITWENK
jgi:hypothetical protein